MWGGRFRGRRDSQKFLATARVNLYAMMLITKGDKRCLKMVDERLFHPGTLAPLKDDRLQREAPEGCVRR